MTLTDRLEEVMHAMNWSHRDLMVVSGQTSSVVSQWLGKGSKAIKTIGKMEAALAIERASGYSALWIAKGTGPKRIHPTHVPRTVAKEPTGGYWPAATVLQQFQSLLRQVAPELRSAFGDVLASWARDGGTEDRSAALLLLLEASGKQQRTA